MADEQKREDLLSTTDCLEAISVFKGWKNFLFIVAIICLVLLQMCFWLADTDVIRPSQDANTPQENVQPAAVNPAAAAVEPAAQEAKSTLAAPMPADQQPSEAPAKKDFAKVLRIRFEHLAWLVRICNYLLIFVIAMYCLTLLFCLKISLLGRLGGINHISRAFLLSLIVFVLILPWQRFFGGISTGLIYTPAELVKAHSEIHGSKIINIALYYLRYCGLWVIVLAILVSAQIRSIRWAKATLRRLGVV
jgi:hypothetical protein